MYRQAWIAKGAPIFKPEYYPQQFQFNDSLKKKHMIEQLKNIRIYQTNIKG